MKVILVINDNKDSQYLPFAEKFKVFSDPIKAAEHAQKIGHSSNGGGIGIDMTKPGYKNQYMCGDINVSILPLEVQGDET